MRISSFLVDDINNDEVYDLVISLDITLEDGGEKTVILRAVQGSKLQFQYDKIDPECGKFLLVDTAPLEQRDYKDFVIITKSLKIALIKNFDPNWMYVEITPNFLTLQQYLVMERLSGPSFHIYIVDFDKDGYLDIVLPNTQTNKLVYLKNPGSAYWRKMSQIVYQANKQKQIQDLKVLEKWQQVQVVTSAFSDQIQDFVLVNIDSEDKLVVVVLSPNAIAIKKHFIMKYKQIKFDLIMENINGKNGDDLMRIIVLEDSQKQISQKMSTPSKQDYQQVFSRIQNDQSKLINGNNSKFMKGTQLQFNQRNIGTSSAGNSNIKLKNQSKIASSILQQNVSSPATKTKSSHHSNRLSINLTEGSSTSVNVGLSSYGKQIINTVPLHQNTDKLQQYSTNQYQKSNQTVYSQNQQQNNLMSQSMGSNFGQNKLSSNGFQVKDDEPAKPMFSMPTISFDLRKEIEMQNKRIEEMKMTDSRNSNNDRNQDESLEDEGEDREEVELHHTQKSNTIKDNHLTQQNTQYYVLNTNQQRQQQMPIINNQQQQQLIQRKKDTRRKLKLTVNTNHCRAELDTIQYVIDKNGYKESQQAGDGNILWYGLALRDHDIDVIRIRNALVNRYPLMDHFAKKNVFCVILSRLQRYFPEQFNFTPPTFLLPDEQYELEEYMRAFPSYTFIAKPSKGRGGDGIFLVKKFNELPKSALHNDFIVQRYIENPYLIDKKKFDFRIYVVIKGVKQIEAYLCDEGLARFCTTNYRKPDQQNIKNLYMHLTNFSLNKNSEKFVQPEEQFYKDSQASKRLLTNIYKQLLQNGRDIRHLKRQIQDIAIKTVISLEPYLKNAYHCFINSENQNPKCFQILGLDIMIDEQLNAWLIEINANPSLNVYIDKELPNGDIEQTLSELDKYVKCMLISDTLKLVGHTQLFQNEKSEDNDFTELGCLKQILPALNTTQYDQYYIYSFAESIFQKLAGTKGCDQINSSQFQKLSKMQGVKNPGLMKAQYDLIFKKVVRKSKNSQMDLNSFFDALEELQFFENNYIEQFRQ